MEKIKTATYSLSAKLQEIIQSSWGLDDFPAHLKQLVDHTDTLHQEIVSIGDMCHEEILADKATDALPDLLPTYILNFLWPEQAKSLLLLWRDIIFQTHKALVFEAEGKASPADLLKLKNQTKSTILSAVEEFDQFADLAYQDIIAGKNGVRKQLEKWQLQHNPWPTYKTQITQIPQQCQDILQRHEILLTNSVHFQKIASLIQKFDNVCRKEVEEFQKISGETTAFIEGNKDQISKISNHIGQLEKKIESPNHFRKFTKKLEKTLEKLDNELRPYPVDIQDGIILFKEINIQKNTRQWLDSEILPILFEHWEVTESIFNAIKIALVNIRNRSVLLSGDLIEGQTPEDKTENLCQPLKLFTAKTSAKKEEFEQLAQSITERLRALFHISEIYDPQDGFLPIPLQYTLKQLRSNQSKLLGKVTDWFNKQQNLVTKWQAVVKEEKALSLAEKIVRFVKSRSLNLSKNQYAGIFLTKGYIGESFWVGRKEELKKVKTLIQQWQQGFRGAIIVNGRRQSGKSLFGDLVANRFFPDNCITLKPNTTIEVQGRTLTTSENLEEALEFIEKNSYNQKPLIWIDDLELWKGNNITLSKNVRALSQYIDKFSNRFFFLVSTSNYLLNLLDKTHEIRRVFHVEINLDHMSSEEIRQAILIRHGATHKTLLDKEEEISAATFNKLTKDVYNLADGNIGEALYLWVTAIQADKRENVRFKMPENYIMPDFIRPDNAILLKTIFLEKRTNEYRLSKLFGTPFKDKYSAIVRRLVNLGLLHRHQNGDLEISGNVSTEVGKLLEQHRYLTS